MRNSERKEDAQFQVNNQNNYHLLNLEFFKALTMDKPTPVIIKQVFGA
jgi:hypothetical protein